MTTWATLPLAVEVEAAAKLLRDHGMERAANRLKLMRRTKGQPKKKVLCLANVKGKAGKVELDYETFSRLVSEAEGTDK